MKVWLLLLLAACVIDVPLVTVPDSGAVCLTNADCGSSDLYCATSEHHCGGYGFCELRHPQRCAGSASLVYEPVCGCHGVTFFNACLSAAQGEALESEEGSCRPPPGTHCAEHCLPPGVCARLSCEGGAQELCYVAPPSCPDIPARACRAPLCIDDLCAALAAHFPGPFDLACQ